MNMLISPANRLLIACLVICVTFAACKKDNANNNTPFIPITAGLKANFGYKTGSYWIYKDSLSGEIDSAYVNNYYLDSFYKGCVLYKGEPEYEGMHIFLKINNNNPADTELWNFYLEDSTFSISLYNNQDSIESRLSLTLFKYPFRLGNASNFSGCVPSLDAGSVTDIIPVMSVNNQNFSNAARSDHTSANTGNPNVVYNDCFYVNLSAGIVKIVFDHPQPSVHRVLELQRYHIVR